MIQKFSGYDDLQVYEGGLSLEVGGYELTIKGARAEDYNDFSILKIAFDIINHDKYANFFENKFKQLRIKNPEAKWPNAGVFDVFIPKDDGSENDNITKQYFKRFTTSVEKSNPGYIWNWDEKSLIGKIFGGVFGREEFKADNGEYHFVTKCRFANSIDRIKSGDFTIPNDKLTKEHRNNTQNNSVPSALGNLSDYEEILGDEAVPF